MATTFYLRSTAAALSVGSDDTRTLKPVRGAAAASFVKASTGLTGPVTPPTTATQWTATSGGTVVCFVTDSIRAATVSGTVSFNLRGLESATQLNGSFNAELYRYTAAGSLVTPAFCTINTGTLTEFGTTEAARTWTKTPTSTAFSDGDRIVLRVFLDDGGGSLAGAAGRTATLILDGTTTNATGDSFFSLTESLTFVSPVTGAGGISTANAFGTDALTTIARLTGAGNVSAASVFGTPVARASKTLTVSGISSIVAFGTLRTGFTLYTLGTASAGALGTAVAHPRVTLEPSSVSSGLAFGSASASMTVRCAGIASGETVGQAAATTLATVRPSGLSTQFIAGTASIDLITQVSSIPSSETIGVAAVSPGVAFVGPGSIPSDESVGAARVNRRMSLAAIDSPEAFGDAQFVPGVATISPEGITTAEMFGTCKLGIGVRAAAADSMEEVAAPGVGVLAHIYVEGLATTAVVGSPQFNSGMSVGGVGSEGATGTPALRMTTSTVAVPSRESFGTPGVWSLYTVSPESALSDGGVGDFKLAQCISDVCVSSEEMFGAAGFSPGGVGIRTTGVLSQESVGVPSSGVGAASLGIPGVESGETFGVPGLAPGFVGIGFSGISAQSRCSSPAVLVGVATAAVDGFEAGTLFGSPEIIPGGVGITGSVPSGTVFGTPGVRSVFWVEPVGISPGHLGEPLVDDGRLYIRPISFFPGGYGTPACSTAITLFPSSIGGGHCGTARLKPPTVIRRVFKVAFWENDIDDPTAIRAVAVPSGHDAIIPTITLRLGMGKFGRNWLSRRRLTTSTK